MTDKELQHLPREELKRRERSLQQAVNPKASTREEQLQALQLMRDQIALAERGGK